MSWRLDGRVALVTGAGSGIGAASAEALAAAGAAVAVTDLDEEAAQAVAARIGARGLRAVAHRLDVSIEDEWVRAVAAVTAELGAITVLHSNAALTSQHAYANDLGVVDLDIDLFDRVIGVNLRGGVLACKHIVPIMLAAGGGSIILTSSVKSLTGSAHRTAYSVSKGGLDTLAQVVATGYGKGGVRCNAVAPGIVMTAATANIPEAQRTALEDAHLTPSLGQPEDIAKTVVFLASDDSAFITGQVLCVDGGLAAHTAALSPAGSRGGPR
jgi:NAD(P)-dependent dehydrogenase (short-subunit alcohol dehydrogenase family)